MTVPRFPSACRLAAAATLCLLAACTSVPPPVEEMAAAEHAVQAAADADAGTLAPAAFDRAQRKLDEARSALQAGQHVQARQLAEQAVVDAELAEATARAEETEQAAAGLRAQIGGPGRPGTLRGSDA